MKFPVILSVLLAASSLRAGDEVKCRSRVTFQPSKLSVNMPFQRSHNGVFVPVHVNGKAETLWFLFDSGSGHTLISDAAAKRLLIHPGEKTTIRSRTGLMTVTESKSASIGIDTIDIDHVDLHTANLAGLTPAWGRAVDGILGYDLLCRSAVTIDYAASSITITQPAVFKYEGTGDTLPLAIRNGWAFVRGTIKVTGRPPVIDNFLIDSGSQDAVNHPIIRDSKGPLRTVKAGVIGSNEWFQLGRYTLGSTQSSCCAPTEETSRQIGSEVLSRFRVTLDYPHKRLILEQRTR
ncbi:MAG TPA: retropepsin-like aspartic protease [Thermoanaerobaculia bacterium]|nr:retropepsin-like aspartic protease [Thermoanaerobaculia bacterium]